MQTNLIHGSGNIYPSAIEFKQVMGNSIQRWLEADESRTKKALAIDLGATSADLSHWLSMNTKFTMHGHLIGLFCRLVEDNSLLWLVNTQHEKETSGANAVLLPNEKATRCGAA